MNALQLAIICGKTESITQILNAGFDFNQNKSINTIELAQAMGQPEVIKLLNPALSNQIKIKNIKQHQHQKLIDEIDKYILEKNKQLQSCFLFFSQRRTTLLRDKCHIAMLLKEDLLSSQNGEEIQSFINQAKQAYRALGAHHFFWSHFETSLQQMDSVLAVNNRK